MILEGAFLVVLNRESAGSDNILSVSAFSPVDNQHQLKLNGVPLPTNAIKHGFTLSKQPGLKEYTTTCVDAYLKDACIDKIPLLACKPDDSLIRITLPCPLRISASSFRSVTFMNDKPGLMPQDHILEYEIADSGFPITMKYDNLNQLVDAKTNNTFLIEIGLPRGTPGPMSVQHAKDFHNGPILKCFKLEGDTGKQIKDIPLAERSTKLLPRSTIVTTTLECKSGGMIGGTP